jgi:hypothetical protein
LHGAGYLQIWHSLNALHGLMVRINFQTVVPERRASNGVTWTGVTIATVITPVTGGFSVSTSVSLRGFRLSSGDPVQLLESLNRRLRIRGQSLLSFGYI